MNIFLEGSKRADCVCKWDELLRTQDWVSTEVVEEEIIKCSKKDHGYKKQIKEAKKAIRSALVERGMSLQEKKQVSIDGRRTLTAYPSYNKDPLHDLRILAEIEQAMHFPERALKITYSQSYHYHQEEHIFHAHYQKVYNGRHYVYGIYEKEEENQELPFVTLAIDRIVEASTTQEVPYRPGDLNYEDLMKDVLGATPNFKYPEVEDVVLCTHDPKVHKLLLNKPLHHSIREQRPCADMRTGLLTLHVQLTQELKNCILYYGQGVEVVAPQVLRRQIAKIISITGTYYRL